MGNGSPNAGNSCDGVMLLNFTAPPQVRSFVTSRQTGLWFCTACTWQCCIMQHLWLRTDCCVTWHLISLSMYHVHCHTCCISHHVTAPPVRPSQKS